MAYTLGNKCAKNLCKRTVLHQLIIKNVVTCFFGTQCSVTIIMYIYSFLHSFMTSVNCSIVRQKSGMAIGTVS